MSLQSSVGQINPVRRRLDRSAGVSIYHADGSPSLGVFVGSKKAVVAVGRQSRVQ
jgi:hypothetical protein